MKKWFGRVPTGLMIVAIVAALTIGPAAANPWPWATMAVGEVKTFPSPEFPCSEPWQIDFGAQFVEIVESTPGGVTVRGTAVSQGPMKLRCFTTPPVATGKPPYTQSLWLQVFVAPPPEVVPEGPFASLLPLSAVALIGAAVLGRRARKAARSAG